MKACGCIVEWRMPQYVVLVASVSGRALLVAGTDKAQPEAPPFRLLSGLNLNSNYLTLEINLPWQPEEPQVIELDFKFQIVFDQCQWLARAQ